MEKTLTKCTVLTENGYAPNVMENISTLFGKYEIIKKPSGYHEFQIIGKEMTKYFGKSCYWLFTKYHHGKIKDAFDICQKRGITDLRYCIGIIRALK